MYDDNLERAIDFLLQQSAGLTEHAIVHAVPPQMAVNPLHSRFGDVTSAQLRSIDHGETFLVQQSLSYFPDVDNGDCHQAELITLAHNTAVTEEELDTYGAWGGSNAELYTAWMNERDGMYGGSRDYCVC